MINNPNPLVSIVTVTRNLIKENRREKFEQNLRSVNQQTYKNIEHIIVDGGSTDGTVKLIETYQQHGWVTFISEKDKGIYNAMNKGIGLAKGKYINYLNSDDYYHHNQGVELSVNSLEKTSAVFSYAPVKVTSGDTGQVNLKHPIVKPNINHIFCHMPFSHQSMFMLRQVMIQEGQFNETYKSAGDYDLVLRLCLKNYPSVLVNKSFITFRFGGISDSNQQQSLKEVASIFKDLYGSLCPLTPSQYEHIHAPDYRGIPLSLANVLKNNRYFNYVEYEKTLAQLQKQALDAITKNQDLENLLDRIINSRSYKFAQIVSKISKILRMTN